MRPFLLALLLSACETTPPAVDECKEFDWKTMRGGQAVTCRMVWCVHDGDNGRGSGMATLWCGDGGVKTNALAKWFCAVADAYGRGEAPWAYPDGRSEAVHQWNDLGDEGFVSWAASMSVTLKRSAK